MSPHPLNQTGEFHMRTYNLIEGEELSIGIVTAETVGGVWKKWTASFRGIHGIPNDIAASMGNVAAVESYHRSQHGTHGARVAY
jgi:hypothetical protein